MSTALHQDHPDSLVNFLNELYKFDTTFTIQTQFATPLIPGATVYSSFSPKLPGKVHSFDELHEAHSLPVNSSTVGLRIPFHGADPVSTTKVDVLMESTDPHANNNRLQNVQFAIDVRLRENIQQDSLSLQCVLGTSPWKNGLFGKVFCCLQDGQGAQGAGTQPQARAVGGSASAQFEFKSDEILEGSTLFNGHLLNLFQLSSRTRLMHGIVMNEQAKLEFLLGVDRTLFRNNIVGVKLSTYREDSITAHTEISLKCNDWFQVRGLNARSKIHFPSFNVFGSIGYSHPKSSWSLNAVAQTGLFQSKNLKTGFSINWS